MKKFQKLDWQRKKRPTKKQQEKNQRLAKILVFSIELETYLELQEMVHQRNEKGRG